MALSTQPYKGARDFYPEDKRLQKYMFGVWREAAERFGYEEYDAPILEPLDIYRAKTGDEIVNEQTYDFEDRGGRHVVIRPEMTPTVSRMVAGRRQELAYPLRWYSIPNLWRYERPQKGRLREHWQLNVDVFGVATTDAELEMIMLVNDIFSSFRAHPDMYEIRINHRGLIDHLLKDYLGLDKNARHDIGKLIDKMSKTERGTFIKKVDDALTSNQREAGVTERLLSILSARKLQDLPEQTQAHPAAKELSKLLEQLQSAGLSNVVFDGTLMRGFDYYTGIIFEVFDTDPENNRSMLGGGRYDGLVGLFGVASVPTVGFGWGDVTLANFLESHRLLPKLKPETDIYVAVVGDIASEIQKLVSELRAAGLNLAVDFSGKKLGDQLKTADKKRIEQVLILGEEELKSGKYTLKNLATGGEQKVDINALTQAIKSRREA